MVLGIAGGLMLAGLLLAAFTGIIWICIGCVAAGLLIAGAASAATNHKEQAANSKLAQYPPYGY